MYLAGVPISSGYGPRPQFNDFHYGVDFSCAIGTRLPALVSGTVVFEGYIAAAVAGYPNELISILQADGYFIVYGHLSQTLVNAGQRVSQGDIIALSGNSGFTSGPHLHIEKRKGTKAANKGLSAYPAEDITPLLQSFGQSSGGGNTTGGTMDKFEYARQIVRLVMDKIERKPNYEEQQPSAFEGHVNRIANGAALEDRRFLADIMGYNGVLDGPAMAELKVKHQKSLAKLEDENQKIRLSSNSQITDLKAKLNTADDVNQVLAGESNDLKATNTALVEESKSLKARIRELESQPGTPGQPAKELEDYSALELIRIALNKFLKGQS